MKTIVHIKKTFQAFRSLDSHLANMRALVAKEVVVMQRMWKTELGPEKFNYIFLPFIFFFKGV